MTLVERLRSLFELATPGSLQTAERHTPDEYVECPFCDGRAEVSAADYCNFDGVALGVQFYGIGREFGAHEKLWRELIKSTPVLMNRIEQLEAAVKAYLKAFDEGTGTVYVEPLMRAALESKS